VQKLLLLIEQERRTKPCPLHPESGQTQQGSCLRCYREGTQVPLLPVNDEELSAVSSEMAIPLELAQAALAELCRDEPAGPQPARHNGGYRLKKPASAVGTP
jgi:hypothetical protein